MFVGLVPRGGPGSAADMFVGLAPRGGPTVTLDFGSAADRFAGSSRRPAAR